MIISDSTPIQFWDIEEDTFNESQPICGLNQACFCLPVNCDQDIPIQFTDENERNYVVTFYDDSDTEVLEVVLDRELIGDQWVYSANVIPTEDMCNTTLYVKISYYQENEISGAITDAIESVDGDITVFEASISRLIGWLETPDEPGCSGAISATVYYIGSFSPGTTLYTDSLRTTLATGHDYVSDFDGDGSVYNINSATAVIGTDTGFNCA